MADVADSSMSRLDRDLIRTFLYGQMTGNELGQWRRRLNLQQRDAAILLNVSIRTIYAYENEERPIPNPTQVACLAFEHWIPRDLVDAFLIDCRLKKTEKIGR